MKDMVKIEERILLGGGKWVGMMKKLGEVLMGMDEMVKMMLENGRGMVEGENGIELVKCDERVDVGCNGVK